MTDDSPELPPAPEGDPRFYANVVQFAPGPFDVTFVFGQMDWVRNDPSEPPAFQNALRVTMSWAHAKSMLPLVAKMIANYEQQFGEIPAPGFDENWKGRNDHLAGD